MESNNEKFFEQLVGAESDADQEYDVELAKATTGATAQKRARTKAADEDLPAVAASDDFEGSLIVDVYQTPDDIVVQSAIAGVKPEDIDISATNDKITIRGAREHVQEVTGDDYLYQECYWGRFAREVIFPQEVDPEEAKVTFKNGILTVRLPKINKKKMKKLKVSE